MKILVGLGNPDEKFKWHRHNSGFLFLDYCQAFFPENTSNFNIQTKLNSRIAEVKIPDEKLLLVKPQTFMNKSGLAVFKIINFYKANITRDLVIIHDDLDLVFGQYKIDYGKGPKVHNGLNSVIENLKTDQFLRLRVGIANEIYENLKANKASIADGFVLKDFSNLEKERLSSIFETALKELFKVWFKS